MRAAFSPQDDALVFGGNFLRLIARQRRPSSGRTVATTGACSTSAFALACRSLRIVTVGIVTVRIPIVIAAGCAPHLQSAIRHAEPPSGKLQAAILTVDGDAHRGLGSRLTDLLQSGADGEGVTDRVLEVGIAPTAASAHGRRQLVRRNVADRNRTGTDMPAGDAARPDAVDRRTFPVYVRPSR